MCEPLCRDGRQAPIAGAAVVTSSIVSGSALVATGTPITDALLLIAGAGVAGALSVRLSGARTARAVIRSLLNSAN
ncbi:hypothetical protein ACFWSF_37990 [Streptomyces sp. NPDC058611]|uniref:hypothetical protein n=1 Tax=unclassified Streptomyces TaxID=2593676 RepID=UPI00364B6C64